MGATASTGPSKTLSPLWLGIQLRDPVTLVTSRMTKERMSHILASPNTAPASLLTNPMATRSKAFSMSLATSWTTTTTAKKVMARDAMWMELADQDTWGASCSAAR
jgi:hypothetical protein